MASSKNSEYAGIAHQTKPIYGRYLLAHWLHLLWLFWDNLIGAFAGIQFHPEVSHTPRGGEILKNFAVDICKARQHWVMSDFIQHAIERIRQQVGDKAQVIGAVSGGVDSTVVARLMREAIGKFCSSQLQEVCGCTLT